MEYLLPSLILGFVYIASIFGMLRIMDDIVSKDYFSIMALITFGIITGLFIFEKVSPVDKPKQQTEIVMFADVNQDGEIDISDMAIIKSHLLGIRQMNEQQLKIADVNKDGEINQIDLEIIRAVILSSNGYKYEFNN